MTGDDEMRVTEDESMIFFVGDDEVRATEDGSMIFSCLSCVGAPQCDSTPGAEPPTCIIFPRPQPAKTKPVGPRRTKPVVLMCLLMRHQ